jgi:hypothetical protein
MQNPSRPNHIETSRSAEDLGRCCLQLQSVIGRLESAAGTASAGAASLHILHAIREIEEMERWQARNVKWPAAGEEPFNLSAGELMQVWKEPA